jgi:hypothetical protein
VGSYHHGVPGFSARVAGQEGKAVAFDKQRILAIADLVLKLDFMRRKVGMQRHAPWCVVVRQRQNPEAAGQKCGQGPEQESQELCTVSLGT